MNTSAVKTDRASVEYQAAFLGTKSRAIMLALLAEREKAEKELEEFLETATAVRVDELLSDCQGYINQLDICREELAKAEAEREALRKDAERYRHMRANATFVNRNGPELRWLLPRWGDGDKRVRLDEAIDAAISAEGR